jgi:antitoxin component YwqK of YwqJK toxin-antitoxin module
MNSDKSYISAIPVSAREEDITGKQGSVRGKVVKNYYIGRSYVGTRIYTAGGLHEYECSYKDGKRHGWEYKWHEDGGLSSALPFCDGREHGTAHQWGRSGTLLGSYTMDHGTGIDFWWVELDGKAQLSEVREVVEGQMDGFEYWFRWHNPGVLRKEIWWSKGDLHGIERQWNDRGALSRGFPKYWIHGERVNKRRYCRAVLADYSLRPFCIDDNRPYRVFPPEVAALIN